jgi:hypothetical protein
LQIRSARCIGHDAAALRELKVEPFDLVIRGGTVVTATDMMRADIGIRAEASPPLPKASMPPAARSTLAGFSSCRAGSTPTRISSSWPPPG